MQMTWRSKVLPMAGLLLVTAVMAACGGGGGSTASDNGAAKATIAGSVTFPSMGSLVAKRAGAIVPATDVTVDVYTLDGKNVATVTQTSLDNVQNTYSYSIPPLPTGVDYVVKVKKGLQVLKKLVEKKDVVAGAAPQNVDAATTATVVIAAQKLSTPAVKIVLGDALPAGTTVSAAQLTALSQSIEVMKPAVIELKISTTVAGGVTSLTADSVNYANVYNMVVAAVSTPSVGSVDSLLAGSVVSGIPTFSASAPTTIAYTNMSGANAGSVVTETVDDYVPPTDNSATAVAYVAAANAYLSQQDIAKAYQNFELALAADSENVQANIGGAITSGMMMLDDEQVKAILAKWEVVYPTVNQIVQSSSPIANPVSSLTSQTDYGVLKTAKTVAKAPVASAQTNKILAAFNALKSKMPQQKTGFKSLAKELGMIPATATSVSEMQTVIDNVIIPKLDKVLARLAKAEGKAGNTFTITAAMQGNPDFGEDVVLGDGEYYALDAAVNLFQTLFKFSTSYNFDVPAGYTYNTISQDPLAMINSSSVFTLKTGGAVKMAAALANAKAAVAKVKSAFDVVAARSLGDGTFDITTWTAAEKSAFLLDLAYVTGALNGPTTITSKGTAIAVDFTKFFTNPLDRTDLPTLGYDVTRNATLSATYNKPVAAVRNVNDMYGNPTTQVVTCSIEPKSDLPDYTLNGILPGNTSANNVAGFNGILPMVSGMLLTGEVDLESWNYTSNGNTVYYVVYQSTGNVIKQIDVTTGVVSEYAIAASGDSGTYIDRLLWYNNGLHTMNTTYGQSAIALTLSPITVTGGTYTIGTPIWTSDPIDQSGSIWISGATSSGTDIYYAVNTWDSYTYSNNVEIRKLSDLTSDPLFSISDYEHIDSIGVSGNYLYVNGDKRSLVSPYAVVASYPNVDSAIMSGGYFYAIWDGKIVKFAGTPSGGIAKLLLGLF